MFAKGGAKELDGVVVGSLCSLGSSSSGAVNPLPTNLFALSLALSAKLALAVLGTTGNGNVLARLAWVGYTLGGLCFVLFCSHSGMYVCMYVCMYGSFVIGSVRIGSCCIVRVKKTNRRCEMR